MPVCMFVEPKLDGICWTYKNNFLEILFYIIYNIVARAHWYLGQSEIINKQKYYILLYAV